MDQIKIGKFIAERRKAINLTQMQLAEKLNITDRAVSKWETGRALPDFSTMPELCTFLGITVNDLLCGECVTMENYNKYINKHFEQVQHQPSVLPIFLAVPPLLQLINLLKYLGYLVNIFII